MLPAGTPDFTPGRARIESGRPLREHTCHPVDRIYDEKKEIMGCVVGLVHSPCMCPIAYVVPITSRIQKDAVSREIEILYTVFINVAMALHLGPVSSRPSFSGIFWLRAF